ncbi:MAG TPA: sugar ABC transporter permease YjfF [Flexilinea sp.]|mgnify:FL=1|nr:sugar ABC transporter permease YjfF [Flexilinea sp.]HPS48294.1 sugar ABC transporter permease YjfF [Flexilinea sp.]
MDIQFARKTSGKGKGGIMINRIKEKIDEKTYLLIITILMFIVMYGAGMIIFADKGFAKPQMFLNLFVNNAGLIVTAVGMTMVMITGGIDISVGSVIGLTCMMLAYMMEFMNVPAFLAILIVLVFGILFGSVQGFLIAYLKEQPFIVTLAGMFFCRGLTAVISSDMINISNATFLKIAQAKIYFPFLATVNKKGKVITPFIYPSVVIALIVLVVIYLVLKYTKFGRAIYAVGGNQQSALLMGLNVRSTKMKTYVLNGFLASLGGVLFALNTCAGFVEQGRGFEMEAIASAVIGGTLLTGGVGNVIGSLFGVLIKGTIESFITTQGTLSSWWTRIVISLLLAFFIVLQSIFASIKSKNR